MENIFFSVQLLSLSVIVGGGILLGGGLRPQFIKAMQQSRAVHELESLHIAIWNAYNRFSLFASVILFLSQIVLFFATDQIHQFSFGLSFVLILLFLLKIMIDATLKKRALENEQAHESKEQKNGHKQVEFLSMLILALSTIGMFFLH